MLKSPSIKLLILFGVLSHLSASAQPDLENAADVDRNVIYGMYSGLALVMDVYYPKESNGHGVIQISGSGWTRPMGYDARALSHQTHVKNDGEPLLAAGYTVFAISHRATPRFQYPSQVEDVQRAVRYIRFHADRFGITPDKIGALGGSSGGHLVSMLGVLDGDENRLDQSPINQVNAKVQCVVARAAPSNFINGQDANYFLGVREKERTVEGSIEHTIASEASPITHVTKDDAPILLVHGDADPTVDFSQSEHMHTKLKSTGVPSKLIRVKNGGHGFNYGGHKPDDIDQTQIAWFDKHLRGK
ncbi:alpha/beta hydrolase [Opitutia bacterium ISCC 51]|nr:alpha/beta hydrolase [Opitutae bacterium ISCC 51]QXD27374.1 alpha/beta hydrolase [Opitutae bacterium ISCC 52]